MFELRRFKRADAAGSDGGDSSKNRQTSRPDLGVWIDRVDDRGWFSLTAELPNRSGFPEAYEEALLDDVLISGMAYQHYLGDWIGRRPSWLQLSYWRVFDLTEKGQGGVLKEDQVKSSLDRYPLRNVAALDWKIRLSQKSSSRLHWMNRYQYSIPEEGGGYRLNWIGRADQ